MVMLNFLINRLNNIPNNLVPWMFNKIAIIYIILKILLIFGTICLYDIFMPKNLHLQIKIQIQLIIRPWFYTQRLIYFNIYIDWVCYLIIYRFTINSINWICRWNYWYIKNNYFINNFWNIIFVWTVSYLLYYFFNFASYIDFKYFI